jgi:hypothetical protein
MGRPSTKKINDGGASMLTAAESELRELGDVARQALAQAQQGQTAIEQGQTAIEQGRAQRREATPILAAAMLKGRELCQDDDRAFGAWLKDNSLDKISAPDREALLNMARYPEATAEAPAQTEKTSWQTIWHLEIKPKVKSPPPIFTRPSEDDDIDNSGNDQGSEENQSADEELEHHPADKKAPDGPLKGPFPSRRPRRDGAVDKLPPRPIPHRNIVARIEALHRDLGKQSRQCRSQFQSYIPSKDNDRKFEREWRTTLLDRVILEFYDNDDNWALYLERNKQADEQRQRRDYEGPLSVEEEEKLKAARSGNPLVYWRESPDEVARILTREDPQQAQALAQAIFQAMAQ